MANEPITREEIMLNAVATGEAANLEPITREEMFLAKLSGADVKIPTPITRKEQFLQKAIEGGGGTGGGGSTDEGWIGDGNTHIWISLADGRTSPMLGVCPKGTVTVDWGDGTEPDVLTGTSTSTVKWTPTHEYASAGDYIITLTVDGDVGLFGSNSPNQYAGILRHSDASDVRNPLYHAAVRKIELSNSVTAIGQYAFAYCYGLRAITIPGSVTSIGNYAVLQCLGMSSVTIRNGVKSIGIGAFQNCMGTGYYDFSDCTSVPTLANSSAFGNMPDDCEIRVPAALYDQWIAATNWTTYASYIKAV